MGVAEQTFFELIGSVGIEVERKPKFSWLINKVLPDDTVPNDTLWKMFQSLGGYEEGMRLKKVLSLPLDGYVPKRNCLIEFDEIQHFTTYRKITLDHYPKDATVRFNIDTYRSWCERHAEKAYEKGAQGYRAPKKEFPFEGGRAAQRALFDACKDLLPPTKGLSPTIRVSEFQVPSLKSDLRGFRAPSI